jgi:hypothetical protein
VKEPQATDLGGWERGGTLICWGIAPRNRPSGCHQDYTTVPQHAVHVVWGRGAAPLEATQGERHQRGRGKEVAHQRTCPVSGRCCNRIGAGGWVVHQRGTATQPLMCSHRTLVNSHAAAMRVCCRATSSTCTCVPRSRAPGGPCSHCPVALLSSTTACAASRHCTEQALRTRQGTQTPC